MKFGLNGTSITNTNVVSNIFIQFENKIVGNRCITNQIYASSQCYIDKNHVIFRKDFHNFLRIMVGQNQKDSNAKEIIFFYFICCDVRLYFCYIYVIMY